MRDCLVTAQGRILLDLFLGQIDGEVLRFVNHCDQSLRGDQHLSVHKPVTRVGDKAANRPVPVIEVEFPDPSYFPVNAVQGVTL
jgi:hypothetical protein